MSIKVLMKQPSAFIPVGMSLAALVVIAVALATYGVEGAHQPDEGAAAHLWQLLMAGQLPIIAFFAIKWLPRDPKDALPVLVVQVLAGIAAAAPVFMLGL